MSALISVIIVNFNSGSALGVTLECLWDGLAEVEWEAVVVDNASSDGSERAAEAGGRIRLVRRETNNGFAVGVNAGMAVTSAPFVLVLNPDCRLGPRAGRLLLDELQREAMCAVVGPTILDPNGTLQESARGDPNMLTGAFGRTSLLSRLFPGLPAVKRNLLSAGIVAAGVRSQRVDWISGACLLVRRDAVAAVGGFDEGYFLYWEDADLCRRLRKAGWETRYLTAATAVHDVGQSSQGARSLANREFHRSAYRYFATHVVPQRWHPGRPIGWAMLRVRSWLMSPVVQSTRSAVGRSDDRVSLHTGRPVARVARIITRLNVGGPSVQALDLSRQLVESGFETCLVHGHLAAGEGDLTQWHAIRATRAVYVSELVRPVSPLKDLRALWKIYRVLVEWNPDIVHTHMAKAGTLGRLAALAYNRTSRRSPRVRLVHTYHGHVFEGYFTAPVAHTFLMIERWLARRTDALIAISPRVRADLLEKYHIARDDQLRLVALGSNLDRLLALSSIDRACARETLGIPEGVNVVTTVGRLTPVKDQSLFLSMAAKLAQEPRPFLYLMVGDGELRTTLVAKAQQLGIDTQVRFLGWRSDLDLIYGATDVFVLTSKNEGTPVSLIEAMAAGVASVSTDVGGVRDIVTGAELGVLVPSRHAADLAAAVSSLALDSARREEMGSRARASVRQRFDGQRLAREMSDLYAELLGGSIR